MGIGGGGVEEEGREGGIAAAGSSCMLFYCELSISTFEHGSGGRISPKFKLFRYVVP